MRDEAADAALGVATANGAATENGGEADPVPNGFGGGGGGLFDGLNLG